MSLISDWVMQIIVFILIGTILELLIPDNTMKKYVNIVIGLLILLLLAKPILYLFQVDVTSELEKIEQTILQEQNTSGPIIEFETQKREIQAEQDAYIWNEVKLQMMNEANPILKGEYSTQISDISFTFNEEVVDKDDNLDEIIVVLAEEEKEQIKDTNMIKPILIQPHKNNAPKQQSNEFTEIRNRLEQIWGLNKEQIHIMWEGGTS